MNTAAPLPDPPSPPDQVTGLLADAARAPHAHDFYALLRAIEAADPRRPRLGRAVRPRDEPLRLGQDPELDFAPAPLSSLRQEPGAQAPRLGQRFFGLFGPMGPLPLHLTEAVRERLHARDATAARFADLFHHRALLLFYRAWAEAQPATHLDRPGDDAFSRWVGSLFGAGGAVFAGRDEVPDTDKRFFAAALARGPRSAEGLVQILAGTLGVSVRLEPFVGHWLSLPVQDRARLPGGRPPASAPALGRNAIAGHRVFDRQYRFRLHLGPMSYAQYERFLPGEPALRALRDWLRMAAGLAWSVDVVPWLEGAEVPAVALGVKASQRGRLGRTAWLGRRGGHPNRGDLRLRPLAASPVAASAGIGASSPTPTP